MLKDEIKNGETDVLEFKRDMPDDHLKFLKTAVVHRQYINPHAASIQVALYDTHLDIVSPGGLPHGMTVKMMEEGHSRARNKALALACRYMRIIEEWGSGIPRIQRMLSDAGLKPLEIIDNGINLQFRIWRPTNLGGGMKGGMKGGMEIVGGKLVLKGGMKTADSIVALMRAEPQITHDALAAKLGKARNSIIKQIAKLKTNGRIRRVGPDKGGHWEVVE